MKLGIVTPTLNAERYLERCLDSIWSHPVPGVEIDHLVVDGASTDRTTEVAAAYPCRVVVAPDGGMYEAVNRGFSLVGGDVIGLYPEPEPIHTLVREGGWDLDALDHVAASQLTVGLRNEFLGGK